MNRDFFDEDLLKTSARQASRQDTLAQMSGLSESDAARARLTKEQEDRNMNVVAAVREMEALKIRQQQLEKEKADLESTTRKQEEYQATKKDVMDRLSRSIVLAEKDEIRIQRMLEVLSVMKDRFKDSLSELKGIAEEKWDDTSFQVELDKAMVLVEDAKTIYRKGIAKIEAAGWSGGAEKGALPVADYGVLKEFRGEKTFLFWLKVGFAVSIPLMILLAILFGVLFYLRGY